MRLLSPTVAALALALAAGVPSSSTAAQRCITGAAEARASGSDEGPPRFSSAFIGRAITIEASTDGLEANTLPIAIEEVCGLPRSLTKEGNQLPGNDGLALITSRTSVWIDGRRLTPDRKLIELDGADTVRLRVRLVASHSWQDDEDGDPVPTFSTSRVAITD